MSLTLQAAKEVTAKLPPVLKSFFAKYPPSTLKAYASTQTLTTADDRNPFLPAIHPVTKVVHDPVYSLRRQSVIFKLAQDYGLETLLPSMDKKFGLEKKEGKLPMKGVVRPKGAAYERNYEDRMLAKEKAIAQIDEKILSVKGNRYKRRLEKRKDWPKNMF
ncbi:mitochondrial 54S ribosomal protein mL59 [Dipodascopsis tothii]|uniref:mitochondrial 54S ribosomal protein mL59 n=1 Tax=Dipodascopsis tothii TaxID=44089 RepID=UPI0034CE6702